MPELVKHEQADGFISVNSSGETNIWNWKSFLKQVLEINKRTNCKSVLVDVREEVSTPGTIEIFEFGASLPNGIRFAFITPEITPNDHIFLETVGLNRGKSIKLFNNYDEGINWLKE